MYVLYREILIIKYIASFILCFATLIEVIAGLALGKSFKIHSPEEKESITLITKGIYGIIRNPVVLGIFCYAFSIMLLNPTLLSLLIFVIIIIGYNYKVDAEAKEIEKRIGREWYEYCKKTGKYFPLFFNKRNINEKNS